MSRIHPPSSPSFLPFQKRRRRVLKTIGNGVALLPTAPECLRNGDAHYPYRFDSDFWYLTGFAEPEAVLVLVGGTRPKSILFCRSKDETREIWDGFRYGPQAAKQHFGFDAAYPIQQFEAKLPQLLANRDSLWFSLGHDAAWDERITTTLHALRRQARAGMAPPDAVHDLRHTLAAMRHIKDSFEIDRLKKAADITSAGHRRAMQACQPGLFEYELEAELSYTFRRQGADAHAYTPIVAGGENACVLHYISNQQRLSSGDLVLIDAGCECAGYAADITRTFPVNGRFSALQRDVYEMVLAAHSAACAAVHAGQTWVAPHEAAVRVLTQGLVDLGLLHGSVEGLIEQGAYRRFYMHRTSHWLGLDVHDAGDYRQGEHWTPLAPGMVLTIEPGLYIRPAADVPAQFAGIGIRIEDDVLVTPHGHEVYTSAPRTVGDIESAMRHD